LRQEAKYATTSGSWFADCTVVSDANRPRVKRTLAAAALNLVLCSVANASCFAGFVAELRPGIESLVRLAQDLQYISCEKLGRFIRPQFLESRGGAPQDFVSGPGLPNKIAGTQVTLRGKSG
jgi:hypothetical protein